MSFAEDDLARLRDAEEVDIETQPPDGSPHRATIWLVVDGDDAFVRSWKGPDARWYREAVANPAVANPAVALHLDGRRLPATAIAATDPDSIDRASAGFRAKYPGTTETEAMATQYLDTTLRLEPA